MRPFARRLGRFITVVIVGLAPVAASAKHFDLGNERFASYFSFSDSLSALGQNAVTGESSATDYTDQIRQNIGGEFGFLYATKRLTWRFGFEVLRPSLLTASAKDSSGTKLYDVTSNVLAYVPKIGLEINFKTTADFRFFMTGAVGAANLQVTNDYSNVTISPSANFTLKEKSSAGFWSAGLGFEWVNLDATSLVFEAGYRHMLFSKLIYGADVTDFTGAKTTGDPVSTNTGSPRQIDLSGPYISGGFRWWLF